MKRYSVKVSAEAKADLDNILGYLKYEKKNPQAVRNVYKDYVETRKALAATADSKRNPDSLKLVERGLKRIEFRRHDYFMLFTIKGDKAIITNIFHYLEDFENKLR